MDFFLVLDNSTYTLKTHLIGILTVGLCVINKKSIRSSDAVGYGLDWIDVVLEAFRTENVR